jgi:hypothetical protein
MRGNRWAHAGAPGAAGKLPAQRTAGALIIVIGLGVIGGEALATMGTHGLLDDLAFVAAGLMLSC